ncbi:MAG: protein kinase, partial [Myxococcales bacterium]|nr:protein kinase [Myxococcales bacterium]
MPLAQLARRARNAKTGAAVLQNAAHYLGEAGARLAAAYWLGRALATGSASAAMQQQLGALLGRGGTFGGWVGLWRESASAVGGEPFQALTRACDASPALEALARALEADKEAFGDEGGALVAALKRGIKHGPLGFFDFLATFRNRVYGHGAMLPEAVARRLALPFLGATSHVLRLPALFDGAWLGRTAVDVLGADGRHYWKRLHGVSEAAVEPTDELPSADDPSPRCLYFVPDARRRARGLGVEGDVAPESGTLPQLPQPVSLSFLVVQDEDATGLSRFGFFQRALGRKGSERGERKARGIEYLDYLGGAFRDDTLADELARLAPAALGDSGGPGEDPSASDETERPAAGRRSERRFGDFVIEAELGRGAMGIVYRATQRALGRSVALKVLPPALLEDPIALGRFHREVQALGRCDHPNVVRVLASGIEEGRPWFAMELVEGADLSTVYATLVRWKGEGE